MELNAGVPIHSIDTEVLLRIGVAALLGPLLGLDREMRGHVAGLRTRGLICVSAAAMAVSVIALYLQFGQGGESRMIGIACGAGQWPLVAICALVSVVMLTLLHFVEGDWSGDRTIGRHAAMRERSE
ncbi:MgtC/SapB family protein [Novosphingobium sp. AP12]|uniref:MgtC/SapB family protein n=1 Tax=Novosphingobium sp. AP12 TaxID=1144305 RepID=UPI0002721522|nr:MgtC/SapB family protein [Novosphingobium sp. AP12]EJL23762.1 putative membrane protein [Novosphingobium sp. AP12]